MIKVSAPFRLRSVKKDESKVPVVVKAVPQDLVVRLEPGVVHAKEWFSIKSSDGSVEQHGQFDGEGELRFGGLDPALKYTLVAGGHTLFSEVPYAELAGLKGKPAAHRTEKAGKGDFRVRLEIDPADAKEANDRFILRGASGYEQVRTVKDDQVPGDKAVDLLFTGIPCDDSLTLSIGDQVLFAEVAYTELAHLSGDGREPDLRVEEMIDEHPNAPTGSSES